MAEGKEGSTISRRKILRAGLGAAGLAAVKAAFPNISAAQTPTAGPKNVETRITDAKATGTAVAKEGELSQIEEQTKKLQEASKGTPIPPTATSSPATTPDVGGAVRATLTAGANEDARIKKAVDDRLTAVATDEKKVQDRVQATQAAINSSNATATGVADRAGIEKSVFATRVADKLTATAQAEPSATSTPKPPVQTPTPASTPVPGSTPTPTTSAAGGIPVIGGAAEAVGNAPLGVKIVSGVGVGAAVLTGADQLINKGRGRGAIGQAGGGIASFAKNAPAEIWGFIRSKLPGGGAAPVAPDAEEGEAPAGDGAGGATGGGTAGGTPAGGTTPAAGPTT